MVMEYIDCYEIRVKSHLGPGAASAFEGFTVRHEASGETVLIGPVIDQAALHGVLMKIRDLGLSLVEVKNIKRESDS
jgi:hypothetical protein